MKPADEMLKKDRGWNWTDSAGLASFLIQMSTSDLSDLDNLKRQKDELDRLFNRNNNYPYSEEYLKNMRNEGRKKFENAWKDFVDKMREINIGTESSSMNESLRAARQNAQQEIENSKPKEVN